MSSFTLSSNLVSEASEVVLTNHITHVDGQHHITLLMISTTSHMLMVSTTSHF
jgi:hypothetical protein